MLKQMLLIGAAAVSFSALAQETSPAADPMTPPAESQTAPDTATPPAETSNTPTPPVGEATAEPAPSGTAATPAQVAQIVDQEFPTYDADSSGDLNEAEFASWMKKLRAATDPTVDTESEAVKTWIDQAFAAADADKSTSVDKEELTGFLSRGA